MKVWSDRLVKLGPLVSGRAVSPVLLQLNCGSDVLFIGGWSVIRLPCSDGFCRAQRAREVGVRADKHTQPASDVALMDR